MAPPEDEEVAAASAVGHQQQEMQYQTGMVANLAFLVPKNANLAFFETSWHFLE